MATSKKGPKHSSPTQEVSQVPDFIAESVDPVKRYNIECARQDVNAFIEYVMVDPEQNPFVQARHHEQFQELIKEHKFLSLWSFRSAGKTSQTVGFLLHYMGCNPNDRIVLVSKNDAQAKKTVAELERYIQSNDEVGIRLHEVFPNLQPGPEIQDEWSALRFTIKRTNKYIKDPTVQAFGLGGNPTSSRADLVILDDLLTLESASSPTEREKAWNYVTGKIIPLLSKKGKIVSIGTPYHPEDILHRIEQEGIDKGTWHTAKFPAIDGRTWDPETVCWPEVWPLERLLAQAKLMTPSEFARQMLCEARDEADALFKAADLEVALMKGEEYECVYEVHPADLEDGYAIYSGVDLAVKKGIGHDWSVIFTILVHPDETRQVLWIDRGQWGAKEIVDRINETYRRYRSIIYVESVAAQAYILQWLQAENSHATVLPFTTGMNKLHPEYGVEGVSIELAKGMWIIPCENSKITGGKILTGDKRCGRNIDLWIQGMLYYRRGAHTSDEVMSSWFAREAARRFSGSRARTGSVSVRLIKSTNNASIASEPKLPPPPPGVNYPGGVVDGPAYQP